MDKYRPVSGVTDLLLIVSNRPLFILVVVARESNINMNMNMVIIVRKMVWFIQG